MARLFILAGLLALTFNLSVQAQDQPHPIAVKVKEALKDPGKPFTMLVHLQAKAGTEAEFEKAFVKAIQATRKEKGCIRYELNRVTTEPTKYILYERWQNLPALEAHLRTPHITTLLEDLKDLLAGPPDAQVLLPAAE